ncbi:MAG: V-type ATP synthase subunit D [Desulfurococcales archaeon]|nr:V-type ATP synthase subunit D [Fervidicoccaceae archaeon]NAZ12396.1 V-type ATP synthase subunit D [Desulfurococcales archaeon]
MSFDSRRFLPTKINLIRLRRERASLRKIRNILVEKRNALILFIRTYLTEYEKLYQQTYKKLRESEELFGQLALEMGYDKYIDFTQSFQPKIKINVKTTVVFTIRTQLFIVDEKSYPEIPVFTETPVLALKAISTWREAFKEYLKVIELEQTIRRLIEELKETQRLINALDNVVLPTLDRAISFIKMILDERAREEFIRAKFIKRRLERAKETA